jgi:hypothetical protein
MTLWITPLPSPWQLVIGSVVATIALVLAFIAFQLQYSKGISDLPDATVQLDDELKRKHMNGIWIYFTVAGVDFSLVAIPFIWLIIMDLILLHSQSQRYFLVVMGMDIFGFFGLACLWVAIDFTKQIVHRPPVQSFSRSLFLLHFVFSLFVISTSAFREQSEDSPIVFLP